MSQADARASESSRRPDFVVIGAMKCGTSSLHDQLGAHAQFFMSDPKEPNFFSDDSVYARGIEWYEALFAGASARQLCGESSTHYTKLPTHPHAAERLAQALPDARLLYLVRDPIDRIVSQYVHEWSQGEVKGRIDEAVTEHPRFVAYSRYAQQLRPYLERYGAERIRLVFFERLVAEPQEELERIGKFLEVRDALHWDAGRGARNASRERMRKSPWRDAIVDAPGLATLRRRFVPQSLRDRVKRLWRMHERPVLSSQVRGRLVASLEADLAELGDWLGIASLDCGSFSECARQASGDWSVATRARFPTKG